MVPLLENLTVRARDGIILAAAALSQSIYLIVARLQTGRFAFPLDDAWIFQTYARNLAQRGEWAFIPGVPSTGSTSTLWTPLVAPGYVLPIDPTAWTYLLGFLSLAAAALGAARLFNEDQVPLSLAVGCAVAVEWHLVWAAASGMETALFTALAIWFWVWLRRNHPAQADFHPVNGLALGLWGGLLALARPEGLLLLAVAGLFGLLQPGPLLKRGIWGAAAGVGMVIGLLPFLGLNLSISGELWPNTFFAKQTEYSVLWQQPYPLRFVQQIGVSLVGAHVLLIPALIAALVRQIRQRPLDVLYFLPLIWVVLHWAVYAARLPVVYQHGRYAIPTIPLIVIYGVRGAAELVRLRSRSQLVRAASVGYIAAVLVAFPAVTVFLGAPAYAADVHFIEEDIADAARWIAAERSDATIVAAHDIGALGYYAPGPLLDLAGLVSPEVVPFMLDGERLAEYVVSEGADYLMVFPQWNAAYETLVEDERFCPVWTSADEDGTSPAAERLGPKTIYRVEPGGCP